MGERYLKSVRLLAECGSALVAVPLLADDKNTEFDPKTDFSKFKTFTLRNGQIEAQAPELNSPLVKKKIEDAIRSQLTAKGLMEVEGRPDLVVNFRLGAANRREGERVPAGPLRRRRQRRQVSTVTGMPDERASRSMGSASAEARWTMWSRALNSRASRRSSSIA